MRTPLPGFPSRLRTGRASSAADDPFASVTCPRGGRAASVVWDRTSSNQELDVWTYLAALNPGGTVFKQEYCRWRDFQKNKSLKLFLSYAAEDQTISDVLANCLSAAFGDRIELARMSTFEMGAAWRQDINQYLNRAERTDRDCKSGRSNRAIHSQGMKSAPSIVRAEKALQCSLIQIARG